jgi:hypothetical protein
MFTGKILFFTISAGFYVYSKYIRASLCISDVPESSSQTYNNDPVNLNTASNRRTDNKYEGVDD